MPQHLKDFFNRYPDFDYDSTKPPTSEFRRLCRSYDWGDLGRRGGVLETPFFRAALVKEFNAMYGKAGSEFHHYERLCRALNVELASISECRQVRCSSHISPFVVVFMTI